ncbi:Mitochondrial distribution and morphology protein 12 [Polyrhizophydium stewartii]|uniref:1-phosphatidylinositol-3-phosphate 5-kinase n=1 Tax=Polyrhizophydium stewartii TaxID=2732419 RepID=A0ABR4NCT6_9FUNG
MASNRRSMPPMHIATAGSGPPAGEPEYGAQLYRTLSTHSADPMPQALESFNLDGSRPSPPPAAPAKPAGFLSSLFRRKTGPTRRPSASAASGSSTAKLISRLRNLGSPSIPKEYWMRDEKVKECYDCKQPFTTFRRKHHCRVCGQIFCRKCAASIVPGARFGQKGEIRVCNFCLKIIDDYRRDGPPQVDPATISIGSNSSSHATFATQLPHVHPHHSLGARSPSYSTLQMPSPAPVPARRISTAASIAESYEAGASAGTAASDMMRKAMSVSLFRKPEDPRVSFGADRESIGFNPMHAPFRSAYDDTAASDVGERATQIGTDVQDSESLQGLAEDDPDGLGYVAQGWAASQLSDALGPHGNALPALAGESELRGTVSMESIEPWRQLHAPSGTKRRNYTGSHGSARYPTRLTRSLAAAQQHAQGLGSASDSAPPSPSRPLDASQTQALAQHFATAPASSTHAPHRIEYEDEEGRSLLVFEPSSGSGPSPRLHGQQIHIAHTGFNAACIAHMSRMLRQTLREAAVANQEDWVDSLMAIIVRAANSLRPDIRNGEDIDIRNFVKIKKIPGGTIADSEYISGVVCTKQAIHKSMLRPVSPARILLIRFPLDFQRVENQFLSLETLAAQEEDHIRNMVARITALRPNVVLVEKTVSRIALEMLLRAGVVVVYNVKHSVLVDIGRCTGTPAITSINQLANLQLGVCARFSFKTFLNADIPGLRKTFMFLEGCSEELGCSIVLRGASLDQLNRVKRVLYLMVLVAYSLKLETSLLCDMYAITPNPPSPQPDEQQIALTQRQESLHPQSSTAEPAASALLALPAPESVQAMQSPLLQMLDPAAQGSSGGLSVQSAPTGSQTQKPAAPSSLSPEPAAAASASQVVSRNGSTLAPMAAMGPGPNLAARALERFEAAIMSGSPGVKFPPPYLLVKMRDADLRSQALVAAAARRRVVNSQSLGEIRIHVTQMPHQTPRQPALKLLGRSRDEQTPPEPDKVAPSSAAGSRSGLILTAAPGAIPVRSEDADPAGAAALVDGKAALTGAELFSPFVHQNIVVQYSNICRGKTVPCIAPHTSLIQYYGSADLTLGQYLENLCVESLFACPVKGCDNTLMSHSRIYVHGDFKLVINIDALPCPVRGMEEHILMWSMCRVCHVSTPFVPMSEESWKYSFGKYLELRFYSPKLVCRAMDCPHDIHRDHISYFSMRNLTIRFEMEPIQLFEVSFPPMRRVPKPEIISKLRQQDFETLRHQIEAYYDSLLMRINMFTIDIVPAQKHAACKEALLELGRRAASERKFLLQRLQQTFITCQPCDGMALNAVLVALHAKVTAWDSEFSSFVRAFLQPEQGEVRRMAVQIKRIFADRDLLSEFKLGVPVATQPFQDSPHFDLDMDAAASGTASVMRAVHLPVLSTSPRKTAPIMNSADPSLPLVGLTDAWTDSLADASTAPQRLNSTGTLELSAERHALLDALGLASQELQLGAPSNRSIGGKHEQPGSLSASSDAPVPLAISSAALMPSDPALATPLTSDRNVHLAGLSAEVAAAPLELQSQRSAAAVPSRPPRSVAAVAASSAAPAGDAIRGQAESQLVLDDPQPPALADRRLSRMWMRILAQFDGLPDLPPNTPPLGSSPSERISGMPVTAEPQVLEDEEVSRSGEAPSDRDVDSRSQTPLSSTTALPVSALTGLTPVQGLILAAAPSNATKAPASTAVRAPSTERRVISIASAASGGSSASLAAVGAASYSAAGTSSANIASVKPESELDETTSQDQAEDGVLYPRHPSLRTPRSRIAQLAQGSASGSALASASGSGLLAVAADSEHLLRNRRASLGQALADDDEAAPGINLITGVAAETDSVLPSLPAMPAVFGSLGPAGERGSIMKTITNLWNGNPANFLPIAYPISATEHVFSESLVVVREDEPSSIIALTLDSKAYKTWLAAARHRGSLDLPAVQPSAGGNQAAGAGSGAADDASFLPDQDDQLGESDEPRPRHTGSHFQYHFADGTTRMQCEVFFAEEFETLRRNCGADEQYVQSLARCVKWDASGGRSGSSFLKTRDDWLVVKQLSRPEMDALYKFAPEYFDYMTQAFFRGLPSMLAKIFGFYRISYKNTSTGKTVRMDMFVMENLFHDRTISRIFDLKGSMRNRHVQSTGKQNQVLMDENLVEFSYESPLFIRANSKAQLNESVWNDTLFLSRLNVMDYSLLVGIDNQSKELVVGIVDFIRTFTWDKKLESWVKETGILGGGGKEPTIVTPRQYKNRFREAMEKYFLMVPDKFAQLLR